MAERTGLTLGESGVATTVEVFAATTATWRAPWKGEPAEDDHPVVHVACEDAQAFCTWMTERSGVEVRLPSEVEWEYAALGGRRQVPSHGSYAWGDARPGEHQVANFADKRFASSYPAWRYPVDALHDDGHARLAPVRSYLPNGYGLFDMSGNVWEWTGNIYHARSYQNPEQDSISSGGGEQDTVFSMRGGSFDFELPFLRIQKRRSLAFVRQTDDVRSSISIGFRIVTNGDATSNHK